MHGAVYGGAGGRKNANDMEWLVLVFREADIAHAVRDDDGVPEFVTQRARHIRAKNRVVEVVKGTSQENLNS